MGKMMNKRTYLIIAIGFFLVILTLVHILIFQKMPGRVILEELYYIPILLSALRFGLTGSLITWSFASILYLPFLGSHWTVTLLDMIDRILHITLSFVFAFLAGYLSDRSKKLREQAELDSSLKKIGQAASAIVHDLRNPLITILGFSRRIHEGKGDAAQAAQLISKSAKNMEKIVNNVLDFSRPLCLQLKDEDLRSIVQQASELCKAKAEDKGVTLFVETPEMPVYSSVESISMQRALVNLINNSIEASEKGQTVNISIVPWKKYFRIIIKDNGPGMDKETLKNIFIPFHTNKVGGTGLGVPIAKKIIDSHKGKITIQSVQGKGTTVTIDLFQNNSRG